MKPEPIPENGKLVVIGGVAAGMSAASQAKRRRPDIEITALEKGDFVSYGACGMPYNIVDPARDMEDLVVIGPEEFEKKRGIRVLTGHEVVGIDRDRRMVRALAAEGERELSYDRLVVATGARERRLLVPGEDLPGIHYLHNLKQGKQLKQAIARLPEGSPVFLVGAGYIGMEMAEVLTQRGFRVTVWARSKVISRFADSIRDRVLDTLSSHDVPVVTGTIAAFEAGRDGRVAGVLMEDGRRFDAALILIGIGVLPNAELAGEAGLERGVAGAIAVNEYMQTSDPFIYAGGDCVESRFVLGGAPLYVPLGDVANKQGKIAGANVAGAGEEFHGVLGTAIFRVFDLEVATTGLNEKEAAERGYRPLTAEVTTRSRAHAYPGSKPFRVRIVFDARDGRLLGAQIAAGEGALRINTLAAAIDAGFDIKRLSGLDMAYAPPFSPVWDPLLTLASTAQKVLAKRIAG